VNNPVLASRVFGIYLTLAGASFAIIPSTVLAPLGIEATEVWIRIVGLLSTILGMYFLYCARSRQFSRATVIARLMFASGIASFVIAGVAPPVFLVFGVVDLVGAAWMQLALHATRDP
jgi:hypothetical protein